MRETRTVVVAGAGIGGLTAALALAQTGWRVVVVERAARLSEVGAGIQITPNAGHVLARLGLGERVAGVAVAPEAIEIRSGRSARRIASLPIARRGERVYGLPYRVVHRGDLQRILAEAASAHPDIELRLGSELVEFGVHANGVTALVETATTGGDIRAAALIGADGVHSLVRGMMPGGSKKVATGRTAWRAVLPADAAPPGLPRDRVGLWLSTDAHFVHYPLRGGREINLVAIVKDDWQGESWSEPGDPAWLMKRFNGWTGIVRKTLAAAPDWLKWALLTVSPAGSWVEGPVALLGDAAHAMPPFLAQGGAMAIEDAAVLAKALTARPGDVPAALQDYAALRRGRVRRVWRTSVSNGELYHMGAITGGIRDIGMQVMTSGGLLARYDWVYRWKA